MRRAAAMDRDQRFLLPLCLLLLLLPVLGLAQNSSDSHWRTLSGAAPLIIAHGGSSGLLPDQTLWAYSFALSDSVPGIALFCDVQLTKDSLGICRTGLDLRNSTTLPPFNTTTREVNGVNVTGTFSIDLTYADLNATAGARQGNQARPYAFDSLFSILTPSDVFQILSGYSATTQNPAYLWLNVEYALFYEQNGYNMTTYAETALNTLLPAYFSATEVALLKSLGSIARRGGTKLVFKIPSLDAVEPSTNRKYSSFTVEEIASFSSGVLVPKDAIWPVDDQTLYLKAPTTIVADFHKANLTVYAGVFANDEPRSSYNYSYDPLREYVNFVANGDFAPDGLLTDFPTTASEAISCYASSGSSGALQIGQTPLSPSAVKRTIISHNGASGDYPGCTVLSYEAAVRDGADYIDCPVQLTKDGVAICHESPDLVANTDVSKYIDLFSRSSSIDALHCDQCVFTFNLTWSEISQLKVKQSNPVHFLLRNPAYDGLEGVLQLSTFLELAKNHSSTGIFIDIQNAYFLATEAGLNAVDTVVAALKQAGFDGSNSSQPVLLQSEDSSALKRLQQVLPSYDRVYRIEVASTDPVLAETVTVSALQQIKSFASAVTVPKSQLVEPLDPLYQNFLVDQTSIVHDALQQNLTVYLAVQRNEPVVFAFDYESDPARELNTLTQNYNVSGFISDYPATVAAFLRQSCYAPVQGSLQSSVQNYTIQPVIPGQLFRFLLSFTNAPVPASPPLPLLDVSEPPIPLAPLPSNATLLPPPPSPAAPVLHPPAAPPSGATSLELPVLLAALMLAVCASLL